MLSHTILSAIRAKRATGNTRSSLQLSVPLLVLLLLATANRRRRRATVAPRRHRLRLVHRSRPRWIGRHLRSIAMTPPP